MKISQIVITAAITTLIIKTVHAQITPKEAHMSARAHGPFDVKIIPQDDKLGDGISRMLIDKQYHGDLDGTSKGQMLAIGSAKSSGVYVAIETFTGTLRGKTGSFSLHHTGIMTINIAPDGRHSYEFEYTLPDTH